MGNSINRLLPRHFKILDLALQGLSRTQIADEMEMSPVGIGLILNSPKFQDELARRRTEIDKKSDEGLATNLANAKEILSNAAEDAAQVHVDLLNSEDDRVKQFSANQVLDRVGLARAEKGGGGDFNVAVINAESLQVLQVALKEAG